MQTILKANQQQVVGNRGARVSAKPTPARVSRTLRQDVRTAAVAAPTVSKELQDKCVNAIRFLAIDGECVPPVFVPALLAAGGVFVCVVQLWAVPSPSHTQLLALRH